MLAIEKRSSRFHVFCSPVNDHRDSFDASHKGLEQWTVLDEESDEPVGALTG